MIVEISLRMMLNSWSESKCQISLCLREVPSSVSIMKNGDSLHL